jgi:hypothetical protein
MAVWLQVYGKKEFPRGIDEKFMLCKKIFSDLELDLFFLDDELAHQKFVYEKKLWTIKSEVNSLNIPFVVCEYPLFEYNNLKVILFDNTLVFLGPFDHFQYVSALTQSRKLQDGYQKLVRTIFEAFAIDQAIYCTEGFFLNDEFDLTFADLEQQIQKYRENQVSRLEDMKENNFFIEKFF